MRKATILLAVVALALVVGRGVAVAVTIRCGGGNCFGTVRVDTMYGTNRHNETVAMRGVDGGSARAIKLS